MTENRIEVNASTEVQRGKLSDRQTLIEHIKAVGQAIIDDAEKIAPEPHTTRSMQIEADIGPCDCVTTINYTIKRSADPRIGKT